MGVMVMMKKVAMVVAAAAMVLPLGLGAIAPATVGGTTAFAATKKAAKKTTVSLASTKKVKKAAYHAKSAKAELFSIVAAADKGTATISKKGKLSAKTTYYATKQVVVKTKATKTAKAKTVVYCYVTSANGKVKGYVKASELVKGAVVAKKTTAKKTTAKKATAKKATAKKATTKKAATKKTTAADKVAKKTTAKKATVKKAPAKKTTAKKSAAVTYTLTKKVTTIKKDFHFKKATPFCTGKFAADQAKVTFTKKGTLKPGKTFKGTKTITVKQNKKNVKYTYVVNGKTKGWVLSSALTAGKFMAA